MPLKKQTLGIFEIVFTTLYVYHVQTIFFVKVHGKIIILKITI